MNQSIRDAEQFVKENLGQDSTGHDWYHSDRVRKIAVHIAKKEQIGDGSIIELAALLHDIPDDKLHDNEETGLALLDTWFRKNKLPEFQVREIKQIIDSISYSEEQKALPSIEAKIVQDADRLDALGAIGIARTFAYGGKKGQLLYDPAIAVRDSMTKEEYRNGTSTSIHHFHEKLLKLSDMLHTDTAKAIAKERHQYMEDFLQQFNKEWDVLL